MEEDEGTKIASHSSLVVFDKVIAPLPSVPNNTLHASQVRSHFGSRQTLPARDAASLEAACLVIRGCALGRNLSLLSRPNSLPSLGYVSLPFL